MTAGATASGPRILAVNDELQILRALKLILRAAGYEALTAASVEQALDVAALSPVGRRDRRSAVVGGQWDRALPASAGMELDSDHRAVLW
jgi:DNA-binding response OmpR family regulator